MNDNTVKLLALVIVGSVAKALFGPPRINNFYNTENEDEPTPLVLVEEN